MGEKPEEFWELFHVGEVSVLIRDREDTFRRLLFERGQFWVSYPGNSLAQRSPWEGTYGQNGSVLSFSLV